jgi:hypothetical protein
MRKVSAAKHFAEGLFLDTQVDLNDDNPWNLPDWQAPEQYPTVERTCDGAWRWEFLRRHCSYRRIWLAYQSNQDAWKKVRSEGDTRERQLARRFQLEGLYSPACRYNQFIIPFWMVSSLYQISPAHSGDMSDFCVRAANRGQYLIAISPHESLTDQLTSIKADIIELNKKFQGWAIDQESPRKPQWAREKFPLYLRVLDALDPTHPQCSGLGGISKVLSTEQHNRLTDKDAVKDIRDSAKNTSEKFLRTMPAPDYPAISSASP